MKFYLAAQFSWKATIADRKRELTNRGFTVTSTWTDEDAEANCSLKDFSSNYHETMATRDLREIEEADAVVLFTVDPDTLTRRGGRHVEFGYGMGLGKRVIVIGPKENIFHHIPTVQHYETWETFLEALVLP